MGRKHVDHARKVALMASQHPRLKQLSFHELPRMRHEEVANARKEALLFLSCGHPEGFGLPLAEAIACGCMVVGYHGLAGRDFALPHMNCGIRRSAAYLKAWSRNWTGLMQNLKRSSRSVWRHQKESCRPTAWKPNATVA